MALNSTGFNGESNSSKAQLMLNTSQISEQDLSGYLSLCEEVERLRLTNNQLTAYSNSGKATMTRQEIFECSNLNDDAFLSALEHQNSYVTPSDSVKNLNITRSIENMLQYFNEDVSVSSKSNRSTPVDFETAGGKVAAVVASFKRKTETEDVIEKPGTQLAAPPARSHIKNLKQKYETAAALQRSIQAAKTSTDASIKTPTVLKAPSLIAAIKLKTAAQWNADVKEKTPSPRILCHTKVKQIAQMFNTKISQLVRRNPAEVAIYTPLNNEYSPDPKPVAKPRAAPISAPPMPKIRRKVMETRSAVQSPIPLPRNKLLPTFRTGGGVRSPMHSPRLKRRALSRNSSSCLIAEEAFNQLSVKDKVLLYSKFIDDMTQKNPRFGKHAALLESTVKRQFARGEVVNEKQETVKHLKEEMEARCPFPKLTISPKVLAGIHRVNDATFVTRPGSLKLLDESVQNSELFRAECVQIVDDDSDDVPDEDPLHVSSLTIILKPSPKGKPKQSPGERPKPMPRKKRNQRFLHHLSLIEPPQKRNNDSIRSIHLPTDMYAPPRKIRRTRSERLMPLQLFQNEDLEYLFFSWMKERNGVDFDIAHSDNENKTVQLVQSEQERSIASVSDVTQKSAVERLLEEAIAKLENTNISEMSMLELKETDEAIEHHSTVPQNSFVELPPLIVYKPTAESTEKVRKPRRNKQKAPAPPIPTKTQSTSSTHSVIQSETDCESGVSTLRKKQAPPIPPPPRFANSRVPVSSSSSTKTSDIESESGVSTLPKPPENELQKSHEQNPAALSEHQLRIQASLQRLNIPDWFRQYNQTQAHSPEGGGTGASTYKPGNFTRKRTQDSGRWAGLNSKTTSLSSLGSQRSDRSPLLLSPSAHSHHGGQTTVAGQHPGHVTSAYTTAGTGSSGGAFSRWSTSHLNSSQTSPSVSQRGSFSRGGPINSSFMSVASGGNNSNVIRNSFRQPYLGWRSTEKLSQRTAHERLASSMLAQQQRTSPTQRTANGGIGGVQQPVTPEIQSSIKEVTSAIVHYVNDQTNQQRSRSTSPNSRKCWLESSFVGIRPLDSPQTPIIETAGNAFNVASTSSSLTNNSNNINYNNPITTASAATASSSAYLQHPIGTNYTVTATTSTTSPSIGLTTNATNVLRMNGLSLSGGAPERSLSSASLEDVLASLLGLPTTSGAGAGLSTSDPYARSTTGVTVSENPMVNYRHMPQQQQLQLQVNNQLEQQRLRRRSEGDTPTSQKQQQQQQQQHQNANKSNSSSGATTAVGGISGNTATANTAASADTSHTNVLQPRRVSLGDSSESCNNKTNTSSELQIRCRNTKCEHSATPADAKKYYKSCHNCSHLYCSRECRRAHWEKHRKACLHSRASNLCRQVLATCKDDVDSQRHLSLLARKGFLSQGRGVVRALFRSAEAAEGFIKHGFQCMGEASYVRWPDLMPAEMGLELYAELLKLSTEYKPDSKMLIYVAICVVSEAPGMGQAPVRWERQLVSRCAKLKLCKTILAELEQQQQALQQQPLAVVAVPEPTTEILILTFNPNLRASTTHRELILSNILDILSRRGVLLRKHYPEIYQRLQSYTEGQTDKFNPVTLHPRDSQTGQSFVCIIMPVHSESEIIKLPSAADGGNRVTTIDVGSPAALAQLDDDELLTRSTS